MGRRVLPGSVELTLDIYDPLSDAGAAVKCAACPPPSSASRRARSLPRASSPFVDLLGAICLFVNASKRALGGSTAPVTSTSNTRPPSCRCTNVREVDGWRRRGICGFSGHNPTVDLGALVLRRLACQEPRACSQRTASRSPPAATTAADHSVTQWSSHSGSAKRINPRKITSNIPARGREKMWAEARESDRTRIARSRCAACRSPGCIPRGRAGSSMFTASTIPTPDSRDGVQHQSDGKFLCLRLRRMVGMISTTKSAGAACLAPRRWSSLPPGWRIIAVRATARSARPLDRQGSRCARQPATI